MLAVRPDGSAYLMHHGVKGMKWGVRKDRGTYLQKKTNRASMYEAKKNLAIQKGGAGSYKARRYAKKQARQEFFANVERERQNPGSTKLNSGALRNARLGQVGQAIIAGREAISGLSFAAASTSAAAGYLAFNVATATAATVAAPIVAAGASAVYGVLMGRHAVRSLKRAVDTSRAIRLKDAEELEQRRMAVRKQQMNDPMIKAQIDSMRRLNGGKDPEIEYDAYGRIKTMRIKS